MNQYNLLLKIKNNNLTFFQTISLIKNELLNNATIFKSTIVDLNIFTFKKNTNLVSTSFEFKKFLFIYNVDAEFFDLLIK